MPRAPTCPAARSGDVTAIQTITMESPCFPDAISRCGARSCCGRRGARRPAHDRVAVARDPGRARRARPVRPKQDRHAILRNTRSGATSASCSNSSDLKSASISSRTTPTKSRSACAAQPRLPAREERRRQPPVRHRAEREAVAHEWISHSLAPTKLPNHDFRIRVGANRAQPYDISIFNISAMSFGSLSANAIRSLNLGAKAFRARHRRRLAVEVPPRKRRRHHLGNRVRLLRLPQHDGTFNPDKFAKQPAPSTDKFAKQAADPQVKMIEVKLSQGAKPGHGGVLPAAKITPEIAETRGVPMGKDCRPASSCASAIRGNSSGSRRRCSRPASCRTSSSSTARKAAPARRRSNSPTTSACRCGSCCSCTTRSSGSACAIA